MSARCSGRTTMRTVLCLALLAALHLGPALGEAGAAPNPAPVAVAAAQAGSDMQGEGGLDPIEARRLRFLFWAYTVIWIILAAYLLTLSVRLRAVREELGRVRSRVEASGTPPASRE